MKSVKEQYETMKVTAVGEFTQVVQTTPHKPCGAEDGKSGNIGNCSDGGRGRSP